MSAQTYNPMQKHLFELKAALISTVYDVAREKTCGRSSIFFFQKLIDAPSFFQNTMTYSKALTEACDHIVKQISKSKTYEDLYITLTLTPGLLKDIESKLLDKYIDHLNGLKATYTPAQLQQNFK